jgi:hypothetical protein
MPGPRGSGAEGKIDFSAAIEMALLAISYLRPSSEAIRATVIIAMAPFA